MKAFPTYLHEGKDYSLPYYLAEQKRGKYQISIEFYPAGARLPVVSMRNAIFMGLKPTVLTLERPLGVHELRENGHGIWMTTMPQEIEQHQRQLNLMHGRVLVGGLGLGVAVAMLENNKNVKEIVVVEQTYEIMQMVSPWLTKRKTSTFRGDLYAYLKMAKKDGIKFDCAFYDIWCPTGERVLMEHVLPLRKASEGVVTGNIENWNEDEMIGQVYMHCQTAALLADDKSMAHPVTTDEEMFRRIKEGNGLAWYFYKWMREQKPSRSQVLKKAEEFRDDLKCPATLEKKWGVTI